MRYCVDAALCSGHGQCYSVAPGVYSSDEDGINAAAGETVEVPAGREEDAIAGAKACPESAIVLLDH